MIEVNKEKMNGPHKEICENTKQWREMNKTTQDQKVEFYQWKKSKLRKVNIIL